MAYLDLDCSAFETSFLSTSRPSSTSRVREVDEWALHRRVIELSLQDGLASEGAPTWIQRIVAAIFGMSPQTQLADARLEALRRFAVLYRLQGPELPTAEAKRMLDAGFTNEAVSRFSRHIDRSVRERQHDRRRLRPALAVVAMLGSTAAFAALLCDALDDPLIASVLAGVVVVTLAALIGGPITNNARR